MYTETSQDSTDTATNVEFFIVNVIYLALKMLLKEQWNQSLLITWLEGVKNDRVCELKRRVDNNESNVIDSQTYQTR